MIRLLAYPLFSSVSRLQLVSLSQSYCVLPAELTEGREVGSGRGAKTYDREKAWFSINHSILSALGPRPLLHILHIFPQFPLQALASPIFFRLY